MSDEGLDKRRLLGEFEKASADPMPPAPEPVRANRPRRGRKVLKWAPVVFGAFVGAGWSVLGAATGEIVPWMVGVGFVAMACALVTDLN